MNVEIGTEAAQFPEKECINGIFLAVHVAFFPFPLGRDNNGYGVRGTGDYHTPRAPHTQQRSNPWHSTRQTGQKGNNHTQHNQIIQLALLSESYASA
jgi:hypothetical protein